MAAAGNRIANLTSDSTGPITDSITAFSGGGQANATQLTTPCNRVTTVGAGADSVKLPPATLTPGLINSVGGQILVMNSGANSMQVYGTSPDKINDVATGTGVAVGAAKSAVFTLMGITAAGVGNWYMTLGA